MREPDWDRPERITPPDDQEVECHWCGLVFDQSGGVRIGTNLYYCYDCYSDHDEEDE